jgi:hypothetical protein
MIDVTTGKFMPCSTLFAVYLTPQNIFFTVGVERRTHGKEPNTVVQNTAKLGYTTHMGNYTRQRITHCQEARQVAKMIALDGAITVGRPFTSTDWAVTHLKWYVTHDKPSRHYARVGDTLKERTRFIYTHFLNNHVRI